MNLLPTAIIKQRELVFVGVLVSRGRMKPNVPPEHFHQFLTVTQCDHLALVDIYNPPVSSSPLPLFSHPPLSALWAPRPSRLPPSPGLTCPPSSPGHRRAGWQIQAAGTACQNSTQGRNKAVQSKQTGACPVLFISPLPSSLLLLLLHPRPPLSLYRLLDEDHTW